MNRIGTNVTVEHIRQLDATGQIQRNLVNAPIKDTVSVPDGGYTIIRFRATNPGNWKKSLYHLEILNKQDLRRSSKISCKKKATCCCKEIQYDAQEMEKIELQIFQNLNTEYQLNQCERIGKQITFGVFNTFKKDNPKNHNNCTRNLFLVC